MLNNKARERISELEARLERVEQCLRILNPHAAKKYLDGIKPTPIPMPKRAPIMRVKPVEPLAPAPSERETAALEAVASGRARAVPVEPLVSDYQKGRS